MKGIPMQPKGLSSYVRILIHGLKIIGLAPFSTPQNNAQTNCTSPHRAQLHPREFGFSKIGLVYNIILSIPMGLTIIPAYPKLMYSKYSNKSTSVVVIDLCHTILFMSTSVVIIMAWSLKQNKAVHILNELLKLDAMLSDTSEPRNQWYLVRLTGHIAVSILLWIFTGYGSETTQVNGFMHWLLLHSSRIVVYCFIAEYSLVLEVVTKKIETVNRALSNFKSLPNFTSLAPFWDERNHDPILSASNHCCRLQTQLATLQWLHSIRTSISEAAQEISDFFSLLMLPSVASFFVSIVGNAFYIVTPLVTSVPFLPLVTAINCVVWLSICFYPIVLLSSSVAGTLKEAQLTGQIVHSLLATEGNSEISEELEQFSLQLVHEKLRFTAFGFFTLDFTLIQSTLAATATYIIIIIQFTDTSGTRN